MQQLKLKWKVARGSGPAAQLATYKGHELKMTWNDDSKLYICALNGVNSFSAESKGELYRKLAEAPQLRRQLLPNPFSDLS